MNIIEDNKILNLCQKIKVLLINYPGSEIAQQRIIKSLPLLNQLKKFMTNIMYDNNYRIILNMLILSYERMLLDKKTLTDISNNTYFRCNNHLSEIILFHKDIIKFHNFIKNKIYSNYIIDDEIMYDNIIYNDIFNIKSFKNLKLFILKNHLPSSFKYINEDLKNIILKFHFEYFNESFNNLIFFIINNLNNLNNKDITTLLYFITNILDVIYYVIYLKYAYFYNIFSTHFDDTYYINEQYLNKKSIIPYKVLYEINKNLSFNDNLFIKK